MSVRLSKAEVWGGRLVVPPTAGMRGRGRWARARPSTAAVTLDAQHLPGWPDSLAPSCGAPRRRACEGRRPAAGGRGPPDRPAWRPSRGAIDGRRRGGGREAPGVTSGRSGVEATKSSQTRLRRLPLSSTVPDPLARPRRRPPRSTRCRDTCRRPSGRGAGTRRAGRASDSTRASRSPTAPGCAWTAGAPAGASAWAAGGDTNGGQPGTAAGSRRLTALSLGVCWRRHHGRPSVRACPKELPTMRQDS